MKNRSLDFYAERMDMMNGQVARFFSGERKGMNWGHKIYVMYMKTSLYSVDIIYLTLIFLNTLMFTCSNNYFAANLKNRYLIHQNFITSLLQLTKNYYKSSFNEEKFLPAPSGVRKLYLAEIPYS